mgnify:CR=1 FL=1
MRAVAKAVRQCVVFFFLMIRRPPRSTLFPSAPLFRSTGDHKAANLLAAARALTPQLNRSRPLDRKLVANVMTLAFGASDAEGAWLWRDAYDAIEAALVLQIRRLAPQVGRLEDAPAEIVALLANLAELSLTHTRRSEEQVVLDQFSTPPQLGALAVLAAQVRPGDQVLEPSRSEERRVGKECRSRWSPYH